MWHTDTVWFDAALVATLLLFGATLLGHFSTHQSRALRTLKNAVGLVVLVGVAATAGRAWMFGLLGALLVPILGVHAWWLPRHGVNGWTAEPRERYYQLLGLGPDGRPALPSPRPDER